MFLLLLMLIVLVVAASIATVRALLTDGYRRVPRLDLPGSGPDRLR